MATAQIGAPAFVPLRQVVCGGTDASNFNENGIEAVAIGCGIHDAHSTSEYTLISELEKTRDVLITLLHGLA